LTGPRPVPSPGAVAVSVECIDAPAAPDTLFGSIPEQVDRVTFKVATFYQGRPGTRIHQRSSCVRHLRHGAHFATREYFCLLEIRRHNRCQGKQSVS